jgi:hypothetical protein
MREAILAVVLLAGSPGNAGTAESSETIVAELAGSEGELPGGWEPLTFSKISRHTRYALVRESDSLVLRAESSASASGLVRTIDVDPKTHPRIRWRWKVENVLEGGDVTRKEGDDYPARLYLLFEPDPSSLGFRRRLLYQAARLVYGALPTQSLTYIWASHARRGEVYANPYVDQVKMIVLQSGTERVGEWIEEERSIVNDYRRAFEDDPPRIRGVGIMTDTDNTGEAAVAYYGQIQFLPLAER